ASCFERALDSGQRTCRQLHDDIAICRSYLAETLLARGDLEAARAQLSHALGNLQAISGDTARVEGHARITLARVLEASGELASAVSECTLALNVIRSKYGAGHPRLMPALNLFGELLCADEKPARAF